ncbi:hypothetical protein GCM10028809_67400 [Spirosoma gilvum]
MLLNMAHISLVVLDHADMVGMQITFVVNVVPDLALKCMDLLRSRRFRVQ